MKTLLIVHHSRTGGARQMAEAAARGAASESEVATRLIPAESAAPADLLDADGLIFACPENLAGISGAMKECFDRCYYPLLDRIAGRPYALMVCAGSDGTGAVRQMTRIITGWRMRPVAEAIIVCTRAQSADAILAPKRLNVEDLAACEDLGATFAGGLALGVF